MNLSRMADDRVAAVCRRQRGDAWHDGQDACPPRRPAPAVPVTAGVAVHRVVPPERGTGGSGSPLYAATAITSFTSAVKPVTGPSRHHGCEGRRHAAALAWPDGCLDGGPKDARSAHSPPAGADPAAATAGPHSPAAPDRPARRAVPALRRGPARHPLPAVHLDDGETAAGQSAPGPS